jgi:hypothetical protein
MMDWNGHMTAGGWIFSILGMLIIFVLVLAAVVWLVRDSNKDGGRVDASSTSARDILDRRLASGEIDVERYEQLRQTLAVQPERNVPESPPGRAADARAGESSPAAHDKENTDD